VTDEPIDSEGEPIGYAEAVAELNEILADLEDDDLDIDILGDRVARAATLIALCRDRIDVARLRVTEIVATLDGELDG
jgi:exodeoxyribonuclease VII small subunit